MTGSGYPVILTAAAAVKLAGNFNTETVISVVIVYIFKCRCLVKNDRIISTYIYRAITPSGFFKVCRITIVDWIRIYTGSHSVFYTCKTESNA